jgi:putative ABC transport system substrate-binding protein
MLMFDPHGAVVRLLGEDYVKRREFITLLGSAAGVAWPLAAWAQQGGPMRRVGVLMSGVATESEQQSYLAAFSEALRRAGWTEGQNLRIDIRWNAGDAELARTYAAQLIGLLPDVILTSSTTNLTVVRQATSTVPVVFVQVSDPVAQGFVPSLSHPGGNITGFSQYEFSIAGKWLDLLKEIAPGLQRVAVMFNPDTAPQSKFFMQSVETAAQALGMRAIAVPVRATADIEPALERFASEPNGGLLLPTDTFTRLRTDLILGVAARRHLPAIGTSVDFAKHGGLLGYITGGSNNLLDEFRRASAYVDRILRGAKPGDLPIQQENRYTLVLNLKTAKALGLIIPPTLLAIADEVIE